jgi:hypothetical protein
MNAMQAPDPIETVLARLMPPALSHERQLELEEMFDELAGPQPATAIPLRRPSYPVRLICGGGIAAAIGALFALVPMMRTETQPRSMAVVPQPAPSGLVLLSESNRVESMTEEGWQEDASGATMRAMRLHVVEENSVRDQESGMKVEISEPRQEILLLPIDSF